LSLKIFLEQIYCSIVAKDVQAFTLFKDKKV
jgi:hypothetical protein